MKSVKPTLKFEQILKWMMVEVLFGRAHYAITRSFGRKDRPDVLKAVSLTRDAHADCAQICAAKIFDRASDASFYTLLSAALKEAGTFKHGTASDVRKAVHDANSRAAGLQATVDALLLRIFPTERSQSVHAACFHFHECLGRAHRAHILPDAKLCHAADFFGNDMQMAVAFNRV
jgi:hypothetical protein